MRNNFQENLERGLTFEQGLAIKLLHRSFPEYLIINNKTDPTKTTGGRVIGPRLRKGSNGEEEYIAPDFLLIDPDGQNKWIDAKLKKRTYSYSGEEYFTLDSKKHQQYMKFPDHMKNNFFLLFYNERTRDSYLAKFDKKPKTMYYDNQYGKGEAPLYNIKDLIKI